MEKQLFSSDSYETIGLGTISFLDCILEKQIGIYPQGSKIDCIDIDYASGKMRFYGHDNSEYAEFSLLLKVVE